MHDFVINDQIYKKRYIHQSLEADYKEVYTIKNILHRHTHYGSSYLAILNNDEEFELCFQEKKTNKVFIYAEKVVHGCICF